MTSRVYGPVSQQQVDQFLTEAQNGGLTVIRKSTVTGTVTGYGNEIDYSYDQANQQITLNLRRHLPFLEGAVWSQVEQRLPSGVGRI